MQNDHTVQKVLESKPGVAIAHPEVIILFVFVLFGAENHYEWYDFHVLNVAIFDVYIT